MRKLKLVGDLTCRYLLGKLNWRKPLDYPAQTRLMCSLYACPSVTQCHIEVNVGINNSAYPLHLWLWSCPHIVNIRYSTEKGTGPTNPSNDFHKNEDILRSSSPHAASVTKKYDRNQSDQQINVAKNQKKKGRLDRRKPSAKKHCLPKGFPKNKNPNNKPQTMKAEAHPED